MSQEITLSSEWNANDYSNIITISSAAIASVLLVIFKSRCSNISVCFGLFSCDREVIEDEDKSKKKTKNKTKPGAPVVAEPEPEPELETPTP
tara:strand:+ start:331 stop:606 length:276 start_codon:yes stop_codon:yes gene_type:complete